MSLWEAALWIAAGNIVVFFAVLGFGHLLIAVLPRREVYPRPGPVSPAEIRLAVACVAANILVTFAGVPLWRAGILRFRTDVGWWTAADVLILLLAMDAKMYLLHRVAHHPLFYGWLHRTHHDYVDPRPLTLFVMNPLETLAFGALWITLITVYPPTWLGMAIYLGLNLAFGMI